MKQATLDELRTDGRGRDIVETHSEPRRAALVGCGDAKHDGPLPARDKYRSTYFGLKRAFADQLCERWWILSAKYGLLNPDRVIDDYDVAITDDDIDETEWAASVLEDLATVEWGTDQWDLYALAGSDYLEAATPNTTTLRVQLSEVTPENVTVRFPFDNLAGIGYQNGWLAECRDTGQVVDPNRDE